MEQMENRFTVFIQKSQKARVILAVFGFAFFVVMTLLWSRTNTSYPTQSVRSEGSLERKRLEELQKDIDGDGLKAWEEAIFRTDPGNPDTDGDGVKDGDEIAQGRDPLVPGPNDALSRQISPDKPEARADAQTNLTALLAQKFGERIILPQIINPGAVPDADAAAFQITNELLAREQGTVQLLKERDVTVVSDNSPERVSAYAQTLRTLVELAFRELDEDSELNIFAAAAESNDFSELERLGPSVTAHEALVRRLKTLPVPSEFSRLHLSYMNTLRRQEDAIQKMRNAEQDIVGALIGASEYAENVQTFVRIEEQFQEELRKRNGVVLE